MERSSSGSSSELSYAGPPYTQETYEPHSDEAPLPSLPPLPEATILTYPEPDPDSAERLNADAARSPDTESPPRRDGRYDRRVSLSTISLEPRRRRTQQHERRHTYDDFKRLMTLAERDAKDMRRSLRTALERVEQSRGRAEHAERIALEMAARLREANEERLAALRAGSAAREELGMYKVQFQTAQAEIRRAQDLLGDQDVLRREAEASAARARDTARALKQAHLVEQAMEEGRRLGYREGVRAGQHKGFWDGRMDDRRQPDVDGEESLYDDERRSADDDDGDVDFDDDIDADPRAAVRSTPVPGQPRLPSAAASVAGRASEGRASESRPALGLEGIGVNLHTLERPPPSPSMMSDYTFVAPPPGYVNERRMATPSPTPLPMQVPRNPSPSFTSTTTLPVAPQQPNGSPLYNRAPRLPEPNVPPTIPEVVNTEPSSSHRSSSRRQSQPSSRRQSQRPPSIYSRSPSPSPPPPIIQYDAGRRTPVYVPPVPVTPPPGEFSYVMAPTPPPPQSPSPSMGRDGHRRSQSERVPGRYDAPSFNWLREGPPGPGAPRAASASVRESPNHRPRNDGLPRTWVPTNPTRPAPLAPQTPTQPPMQVPSSPRNIYAPQRAASASTNSFYAPPRANGYARPLTPAASPGRRDGARVLVSEGGVDEPNIFLESPSLHSTLERTPRTTEDSGQFRAQMQDADRFLSPNQPVVPLPQPQRSQPPSRPSSQSQQRAQAPSRPSSQSQQRAQPPSRPPSQSQQRAQPPSRPPSQQQQQQPPPSIYSNVPGPSDGAWPNPINRGRPPSTVSSSSSPTGYFSSKTTTVQTGPDPNAVRREPGSTERMLMGFDMAPMTAPTQGQGQGANLQRSRRTQKDRAPPPMVYAPGPGSPRPATPVLQVPAPAPGALHHPQRSGSGSPYPTSPRANGAPLPVPVPRPSSPAPLMTPGSRNARLPHHHHYRGESGDAAALPPGRPGSPYRHYDPRGDADISRLAAESAERLAGM